MSGFYFPYEQVSQTVDQPTPAETEFAHHQQMKPEDQEALLRAIREQTFWGRIRNRLTSRSPK
jgi:hypothetical protein